MSKKPEKDPKESRDPAKGGFCGGKMEEKMEEMMGRCAEIMPGMMAAFGTGLEEEKKTDAPAGCCSGSEDSAGPAAGQA